MNAKVADFQARVRQHIDDIWVKEPVDIYLLKNGYAPSGAGCRNQYFTTTVMLSGEVRAQGVQIMPRLLEFSQSGMFTLEQMKRMVSDMLRLDCGVISYFGLRQFGDFLVEFRALQSEIESLEDMSSLLSDMFTMANRYQLWMHQIFPWYLSVHFPKLNPEEAAKLVATVEADRATHPAEH